MKVTKSQIQGAVATLAVHAVAVVLLLLLVMRTPQLEAESGIPVMLGNTELAQGHTESYQFTEVSSVKSDVPNIENAPQTQPKPQVEEPLITQPDEPTVEMPTPEEIEAQKRAEAERLAAERAAQQMASAFGKGFEMGSKGTAEEAAAEGTQGTQEGVAGADKAVGVDVHTPHADLAGRWHIGGDLPRPSTSAQEEGRIVVNIVVNPAGKVIGTSINLHRSNNASNLELCRAAEEAAKRTHFNSIDGVRDAHGTITYYFTLK